MRVGWFFSAIFDQYVVISRKRCILDTKLLLLLLLVYCCSNSRSMTHITWQAAVDDEEQRPLLQDILEAAVDNLKQSYYGTVIGNHMQAIEWCHFR